MTIQHEPLPGLDETHDPGRRSWVASANLAGTDFPIQNLPLGIFSPPNDRRRFGVAIGDAIFDVGIALDAGLLHGDTAILAACCAAGRLNDLFEQGPNALSAVRRQIGDCLDATTAPAERARAVASLLHRQADCTMHVPVDVRNYTDFFAGIHHARAAGALLRPDDPLPANYHYVPIAYHGRASSVRASGAIRRPRGQLPSGPGQAPRFAPTGRLDFELELGFYIGRGNPLGEPIPIAQAGSHIAGLCLLNDWSARDIQRWEMAPLGPFLAKSFSTTVSPWVVTAQALQPFRTGAFARAAGEPAPLSYLHDDADAQTGGYDIELEVLIETARMREAGAAPVTLVTSNARYLYWTLAQMVTHHSSGGCNLQPGDLIGTGTISGPARASSGSMLELTAGGAAMVTLPNGERRGFLEDGDEIILSARCTRDGFVPIGFGRAIGRVV